jgi:hypothetical protein
MHKREIATFPIKNFEKCYKCSPEIKITFILEKNDTRPILKASFKKFGFNDVCGRILMNSFTIKEFKAYEPTKELMAKVLNDAQKKWGVEVIMPEEQKDEV